MISLSLSLSLSLWGLTAAGPFATMDGVNHDLVKSQAQIVIDVISECVAGSCPETLNACGAGVRRDGLTTVPQPTMKQESA